MTSARGAVETVGEPPVGQQQHRIGPRGGHRIVRPHHDDGLALFGGQRAAEASRTWREVWLSRAPVGFLSAKITAGWAIMARGRWPLACCWPPESSTGRCLARSARLDRGERGGDLGRPVDAAAGETQRQRGILRRGQ